MIQPWKKSEYDIFAISPSPATKISVKIRVLLVHWECQMIPVSTSALLFHPLPPSSHPNHSLLSSSLLLLLISYPLLSLPLLFLLLLSIQSRVFVGVFKGLISGRWRSLGGAGDKAAKAGDAIYQTSHSRAEHHPAEERGASRQGGRRGDVEKVTTLQTQEELSVRPANVHWIVSGNTD